MGAVFLLGYTGHRAEDYNAVVRLWWVEGGVFDCSLLWGINDIISYRQ